MKIGVFTPTHSSQWLADCHTSLLRQTGVAWSWTVVPNGALDESDIPLALRRDPRVQVRPYPASNSPVGIGALKKFACDHALSDPAVTAVLELDHDDMLLPGALSDAAQALQAGAGFVYSDVACFLGDQYRAQTYSPQHGWRSAPLRIYGHPLLRTLNFPLTPASLRSIHYSPDHFRCWSRHAYEVTGGHDAKLLVGDDHDLLCRTYLLGEKFAYTNRCGYLYRFHETNSVKTLSPEIQKQDAHNRNVYLRDLVRVWGEREDAPWGDLQEWWDAGWNITQGSCPVADNSLTYIRAFNCLQKYSEADVHEFMRQAYRALRPGGFLMLDVPLEGAPAHASHRTLFREDSFQQFDGQFATANLKKIKTRRYSPEADRVYLQGDFIALKGQRCPGRAAAL